MDTRWSEPAYAAALAAAENGKEPRPRWSGQNGWDAENMVTESTRFPRDLDAQLRRCCREAHVTRYHLINYMLRLFIAAWEAKR